jgi:hypothetical protein
MTPADLIGWAGALLGFVLALGLSGALVVLFVRFLESERAALATYRAQEAQRAAEAKAAEQQAELEAADILEKRLALPFNGGTTTLGEQLERRMDNAAHVIQKMQDNQEKLARQLTSQGAQLTAVLSLRERDRRRVLHTDTPLRPDGGQR